MDLYSNHALHIGRALGLLTAEKNELDGLEKKNLGNWNPDVMEAVYSSKIPLKALRAMAGHRQEKGFFFVSRGLKVGN
jgi:hypothetical protein